MIEYRVCWTATTNASFQGEGEWRPWDDEEATRDQVEMALSDGGGISDGLDAALQESGFEWWIETRVGASPDPEEEQVEQRYPQGQFLRHHGGSVWKVIGEQGGDYVIRCVVGTKREGWIGGEEEGVARTVHPDYLHGDGWRLSPDLRTRWREVDGV